jgi:RNA:NAD 2'-phosphotransferase (TPT1/KptA family)
MMDCHLITVSKFLAKHLRYAPEALGLTLRAGGPLSVDEFLAASQRIGFAITYDELIERLENGSPSMTPATRFGPIKGTSGLGTTSSKQR